MRPSLPLYYAFGFVNTPALIKNSDPTRKGLRYPSFIGYPDYLVGMRERKVADKLNPQRISWLMAR